MAHRLYNTANTMIVAGAAMGAARAQQRRMLDGAAALRAASVHAAAARQSREAAEARLAAAHDRLARARAARAALKH